MLKNIVTYIFTVVVANIAHSGLIVVIDMPSFGEFRIEHKLL